MKRFQLQAGWLLSCSVLCCQSKREISDPVKFGKVAVDMRDMRDSKDISRLVAADSQQFESSKLLHLNRYEREREREMYHYPG